MKTAFALTPDVLSLVTVGGWPGGGLVVKSLFRNRCLVLDYQNKQEHLQGLGFRSNLMQKRLDTTRVILYCYTSKGEILKWIRKSQNTTTKTERKEEKNITTMKRKKNELYNCTTIIVEWNSSTSRSKFCDKQKHTNSCVVCSRLNFYF